MAQNNFRDIGAYQVGGFDIGAYKSQAVAAAVPFVQNSIDASNLVTFKRRAVATVLLATQATQFAVPPPIPPPAVPNGWQTIQSAAPRTAKAQPTQATQFAVPRPPIGASGTLVTTEAADTTAFSGTFTPLVAPQPMPLFYDAGSPSPRKVYYQAFVFPLRPPTAIGTLAVTEAPDNAAFTATYAVTGTLATTEGQDVVSFNGFGVAPSGTLAVTEAPDSAAFTGNFVVSGTLSTTEAPDTAAFTVIVASVPAGALVTTEAPDNVVFLIDYIPPPITTSPVPYPSIYDYGWYDRRPPLRRGHGPGR